MITFVFEAQRFMDKFLPAVIAMRSPSGLVVMAGDCRSQGLWFKSGFGLFLLAAFFLILRSLVWFLCRKQLKTPKHSHNDYSRFCENM